MININKIEKTINDATAQELVAILSVITNEMLYRQQEIYK